MPNSKLYSKEGTAIAAARRLAARHGSGFAVVKTEDMPKMFQVVTTNYLIQRLRRVSVVTWCRLFYGVRRNRPQAPVIEMAPLRLRGMPQ